MRIAGEILVRISGEYGPFDILVIKVAFLDKEGKPVRFHFVPPRIHKTEMLTKML
jgi:hypothetical protein